MKNILAPVMALLLGATAMAGESVSLGKLTEKTLPPDVYAKLSKGKQLTYLWKAPGFQPGLGFKVGKVEWRAETIVADAHVLLGSQASWIAPLRGNHYTLDLAVTDASADRGGFWTPLWRKHGYFVLEGRVLEPDGSLAAAFITKEEDQFGGVDNGPTFLPGVWRSLNAISSELFKK